MRFILECIFTISVVVYPLVGLAQDTDLLRKDFLGHEPPEVAATPEEWIAGQPTTLAAHRGKVIWLQFNF